MQQPTTPLFTHTYHNHSNISFTDIPQPPAPPGNNIRSLSQVGTLMTDKMEIEKPVPSKSVYHYSDKVGLVEREILYCRPDDPLFQRNNVKYQEFYSRAKKFMKPYTDCTKYSDSLMKNRQLLRRGQFDLPTEPISTTLQPNSKTKTSFSHIATSTHNTLFLQTKNLLKRSCQTMQNIRKRKPSSDRKNGFDRTLDHCASTYQGMLGEERKGGKEEVRFKNSMNRILAAQMVNYRLLSKGDFVKPQSVRLEKRQH